MPIDRISPANSPPLALHTEENQPAASSSQAAAPAASLARVPLHMRLQVIDQIPLSQRHTFEALCMVSKEFRDTAMESRQVSALLERANQLGSKPAAQQSQEFDAICNAVDERLSSGKHRAAVLAALSPKLPQLPSEQRGEKFAALVNIGRNLPFDGYLEIKSGKAAVFDGLTKNLRCLEPEQISGAFVLIKETIAGWPYEDKATMLCNLASQIYLLPEQQKSVEFDAFRQANAALPREHRYRMLECLVDMLPSLPLMQSSAEAVALIKASGALPPVDKDNVLATLSRKLVALSGQVNRLPEGRRAEYLLSLIEASSSLPDQLKFEVLDGFAGNIYRLPLDQRLTVFVALKQASSNLPHNLKADMFHKLATKIPKLPERQKDAGFEAIRIANETLPRGYQGKALAELAWQIQCLPRTERGEQIDALIRANKRLPGKDQADVLLALIKKCEWWWIEGGGAKFAALRQAIDALPPGEKGRVLEALGEAIDELAEHIESLPPAQKSEGSIFLITLIKAAKGLPDEGCVLETLAGQIEDLPEKQKERGIAALGQAIQNCAVLEDPRKEVMLAALAEQMKGSDHPGYNASESEAR